LIQAFGLGADQAGKAAPRFVRPAHIFGDQFVGCSGN
jgi:hypothetical protein